MRRAAPLPGSLTEVVATADDGTAVRSWLVLPGRRGHPRRFCCGSTADRWPAGTPGIGGGIRGCWRRAVTRCCCPDPALSTGYGQDFIQRGWGTWGGAPYDDLMAATDAACAHPRIDAARTAVMGGSFGGYMANWIAGHTDRFDAIVTHASLWALDQFNSTTDAAYYWVREMTREMANANSPHASSAEIRTPMLVIHGDKDYRVPIGEALRLWYELLTESGLPAADDGTSPHRFLYFPSENHWVLSPQNAKIWYQVVIAFLAQHVLGEDRRAARDARVASAAMSRTQREFDIVLYGATGFVGKLTAQYLAKAGGDARIALAGRSQDKLLAVRETLGETAQSWPLITADASQPSTLNAMAARAQVVVTTVGPYNRYGLPLVAACAAAGTDYADLTGEPMFIRESIDLYHKQAVDTGARIVHACGFDSIPSDLTVYALYRRADRRRCGRA